MLKWDLNPSPLDERPVTYPHNQPTNRCFFSKIFDVIMQCKLFMAGDSKFWKLSSFKLVFENFWMTKKSKNDEIVLISSDEFNLEFWEQFIIYKKSFGFFWSILNSKLRWQRSRAELSQAEKPSARAMAWASLDRTHRY